MKRCRLANPRKASSENENLSEIETRQRRTFGTTILDLDRDILIEIFLCLPPISFIYCKVVCKEWYELLSQSRFCILYLKNPPYISLVLSNLVSRSVRDKVHLISLRKDNKSSPEEPILSRRLNLKTNKHLELKGSCNGLLYLTQYATPNIITCISNPMTREYIYLPKITSSRRLLCRAYGFGFSSNYKVLVVESYQHPTGELRVDCRIFTIGVDSKWRELMADPFVACGVNGFATNLNGAFHWLVGHPFLDVPEDNLVLFNGICAFDIVEERFRAVPPPPGNVISNGTELSIGELEGHLCIFDGSISRHLFDIWTMNEYGNGHSWTKNYIMRSWIPSGGTFPRLPLPVTSWRNGEILAHSRTRPYLFSFNQSEETAEVFHISGFEGLSLMLVDLFLYTPNFLPLKGALEGQQDDEGKRRRIPNIRRT